MSSTFFSEQRKVWRQRKSQRVFAIAIGIALIMGVVIVPIEAGEPGAKINNLGDGLWWAFQTITTVGYGDVTPVSGLGRILAAILVLTGAALYGVLIAMISSSMSRSQEEFYWLRLFERIDRIETELSELRKRTNYLVEDMPPDHSSDK